jgi:DNA helicase-2/ATP-dependent DNA helicase PcrA
MLTDGINMTEYLNDLNPEQLEAVVDVGNPCLVVAGAGTGKTRVITYKTLFLTTIGVHPQNILLLTFTKKAAQEMLQRVRSLSGMNLPDPVGGTFHAFALDSLRHYSGNRQQVIDEGEVRSFFRVRVKDLKLDKGGIDPYELMQIYSKVVNKGVALHDLLPKTWLDYEKKIVGLQKEYSTFKQRQDLLDFDDILVEFNTMLCNRPEIRKMLGQKLRYILVDEYQDTNILQANMLDLLTQEHEFVTAVGDYAQSIYGFRGANPDNINTFLEKFPHARIIKLNQNYRSNQNIIKTVNSFYKRLNLGKLENPLKSEIKSKVSPKIVVAENQYQMSDFIIKTLGLLNHSETSILYRGNYDARGLEYALVNKGIPYKKYGGQEIKEARHIKDFISYLRVILNPKDLGAWKRLLMFQKGIGKETAKKILEQVELNGLNGLNAKGKVGQNLRNLYWLLTQEGDVTTTIDQIHSHYKAVLNSQKDLKSEAEAYETRVKDIDNLCVQWRISPKLQDIVDAWYTSDAFDDEARKGDKLTLSTIHSAKGLEWDNVFIVNLTDGRLPSSKSFESEKDMEEEHRLFYVAMTRARNRLYMCYPRAYVEGKSVFYSKPSRFLEGLNIKPAK